MHRLTLNEEEVSLLLSSVWFCDHRRTDWRATRRPSSAWKMAIRVGRAKGWRSVGRRIVAAAVGEGAWRRAAVGSGVVGAIACSSQTTPMQLQLLLSFGHSSGAVFGFSGSLFFFLRESLVRRISTVRFGRRRDSVMLVV